MITIELVPQISN